MPVRSVTLPGCSAWLGVLVDDVGGDEHTRAWPGRCDPRCCGTPSDGGGSGGGSGDQPPSGLPAAEIVPDRRVRGSGFAPSRPAEQPALSRGDPPPGAVDRARTLYRFRSDTGGREAVGGPRFVALTRDPAPVDAGRGFMARSHGTAAAGTSTPPTPGLPGRTDPDRWLRALVVRRTWTAMYPAGLCRRRHKPADASAVCRLGISVRLFPGDAFVSGGTWQAVGLLQRQAQHFQNCQG